MNRPSRKFSIRLHRLINPWTSFKRLHNKITLFINWYLTFTSTTKSHDRLFISAPFAPIDLSFSQFHAQLSCGARIPSPLCGHVFTPLLRFYYLRTTQCAMPKMPALSLWLLVASPSNINISTFCRPSFLRRMQRRIACGAVTSVKAGLCRPCAYFHQLTLKESRMQPAQWK